jgi:hypothetical protein
MSKDKLMKWKEECLLKVRSAAPSLSGKEMEDEAKNVILDNLGKAQ